MLNVETTAPNRLHLNLKGRMDANAMTIGLDALVEQAAQMENARVLYTVEGDFEVPTPGALLIELPRLPRLFALLHRFERCAVVAPQAWVRQVAEAEGHLLPGLEIKAFTPDDREAAERWLEASDG
ncbi:STAS/SEC14 domain-containing protein [Parvularcula dongshanensis]|uniref:STAS/SEC14 domain-containing protein n=1 Tax=Parvularcula dongshanensis TaxID=1173995 RepID=A0A840I5W4_9PROT|nr:STAS/SEC14 domain-containing protein [Parvularcula dongshanensis]MBB4660336.1 hypothetical protein [Parvularcula dongshanensis]